jgi:hypothetical protein
VKYYNEPARIYPWKKMHQSRAPSIAPGTAAQHHELAANLADGLAVVLAEVRYGLEVGHQAAGQPNQLDVALALPVCTENLNPDVVMVKSTEYRV